MTDTFSKEKRHEVMSKIKSSDTKMEVRVRHWLHAHGVRYRKNCKDIIGRPDIAIKKYKIAIFVHGCFWHGHENCKYFRLPKSNLEYWKPKLQKNIERDKANLSALEAKGWNVFVLWECGLKADFDSEMQKLFEALKKAMNKGGKNEIRPI